MKPLPYDSARFTASAHGGGGLRVLDLFSAAAGGWSLGLHRAGFQTVAACEWIEWRRALYAENNPGVLIYDDVRTLTGERLLADLGALPDIVVGSPPCQDISSANTKGKGVDGERSGLFFEAVRVIGEVRPRWFALENSANLRTKGSDRVLGALEGHGYACWPFVVSAEDIGANHERKRSWLIGCDVAQLADAAEVGCLPRPGDHEGEHARLDRDVTGHDNGHGNASDADGAGRPAGRSGRGSGLDLSVPHDPFDASSVRHEGRRTRGRGADGDGSAYPLSHAHNQGQPDGAEHDEVGRGESLGGNASEPWAGWNGGLAGHLRVDDGLSARLAGTRVAVGGPRGTAAASLVVEAFGDSVLPQIPEAIGRAILRVEAAYAALTTGEQRRAA